MLVRKRRYAAGKPVIVRGSTRPARPGLVLLVFDNTYSIMSPKHVSLRARKITTDLFMERAHQFDSRTTILTSIESASATPWSSLTLNNDGPTETQIENKDDGEGEGVSNVPATPILRLVLDGLFASFSSFIVFACIHSHKIHMHI